MPGHIAFLAWLWQQCCSWIRKGSIISGVNSLSPLVSNLVPSSEMRDFLLTFEVEIRLKVRALGTRIALYMHIQIIHALVLKKAPKRAKLIKPFY